jgi:hypothetical protein|eukprot:COSAG02_NODE_15136_length_1200_cov_17.357856_1_plen_64_part_00
MTAVTSRGDGEGGAAMFLSAREAASPIAEVDGSAGATVDADVYSQEDRNPRSRTHLPKVDFDW